MDLTDSVLAGRYKVYGELCRGYYGITWGAFDLSVAEPGNNVCIKVSLAWPDRLFFFCISKEK